MTDLCKKNKMFTSQYSFLSSFMLRVVQLAWFLIGGQNLEKAFNG